MAAIPAEKAIDQKFDIQVHNCGSDPSLVSNVNWIDCDTSYRAPPPSSSNREHKTSSSFSRASAPLDHCAACTRRNCKPLDISTTPRYSMVFIVSNLCDAGIFSLASFCSSPSMDKREDRRNVVAKGHLHGHGSSS